MEELRRFQYVTDDQSKKDRLDALIKAKNLSREDLILVLSTMAINPDILLQAHQERSGKTQAQAVKESEDAKLVYAPGSQKYYESIAILGVKVESVNASPGHIHITLIVETGYVAEILRKQYLDACMSQNPIGYELTVSIKERKSND